MFSWQVLALCCAADHEDVREREGDVEVRKFDHRMGNTEIFELGLTRQRKRDPIVPRAMRKAFFLGGHGVALVTSYLGQCFG